MAQLLNEFLCVNVDMYCSTGRSYGAQYFLNDIL